MIRILSKTSALTPDGRLINGVRALSQGKHFVETFFTANAHKVRSISVAQLICMEVVDGISLVM